MIKCLQDRNHQSKILKYIPPSPNNMWFTKRLKKEEVDQNCIDGRSSVKTDSEASNERMITEYL